MLWHTVIQRRGHGMSRILNLWRYLYETNGYFHEIMQYLVETQIQVVAILWLAVLNWEYELFVFTILKETCQQMKNNSDVC